MFMHSMYSLLLKAVVIEVVKTNVLVFVTLKIILFIEVYLLCSPCLPHFGRNLILYVVITPPAERSIILMEGVQGLNPMVFPLVWFFVLFANS